ncbi:hypothetical protein KXX16_003635 [Aspergillus fumigatus]|nr:hypothetical protein KXX58_003983 [Aspergillus fumigatus]KAH1484745.1 hypothetical protein KXX26_000559 [Aspergillus fumigatus]KAH1641032.1 hypothetical protein KXX16_003635 [Aspergillus fumigatus]KAH1742984.1 hypothetical protein KXX41_002819 [Aspergillus fumigatus]KAH2057721.1 hypothetical protein KXV43_000746 [Aspergillus fumigatus]
MPSPARWSKGMDLLLNRESKDGMQARIKPIACRRCHARKVKCSGGSPCNGCRQANKEAECVYPKKNRLVKVSQQHLEDLVAENQRLRRQSNVLGHGINRQNENLTAPATEGPALADTPWFVNTHVSRTPILIAEASDSAFATRFRQALSNCHHQHIARTDFPSDEHLRSLSDADCPWPSPARARFLVGIALKGLGRCYHIVRRSSVLAELDYITRSNTSPGFLSKSKLWVLFAIGEIYATRSSVRGKEFPGIRYFAQAMRVLSVVSERPHCDLVEIWLLLSFYSLCLNRRHSAYSLAGSAIRMAIIMGLHLNIPESQLSDVCEREHRNRLWWTAYTLDRMWAAKLGYPYAIQDDEIEVDLPLNREFLDDSSASDFPDSRYFVARIGLARISGRIIHSIYGMKTQPTSLSQRVQEAFRDLRQWMDELPTCLQIDPEDESEVDPRIRSLHLLFNQLAILATRPILLHVLRTQLDAREKEPRAAAKVPASATALSEACIRCARHSCSLLVDSWANGSFMVFDYFYTQYLFSAATVLGISSLLDSREPQRDDEQFEVAVDLLSRLLDSGNFVAAEAHKHIAAAIDLMTARRASAMNRATTAAVPSMVNTTSDGSDVEQVSSVPEVMTAGMALCDPVLQDLLDQPLPDLQFIDSSMNLDELVVFPGPP